MMFKKNILAMASLFFVSYLNAIETNTFDIDINECQEFPSNFSLAPEEIYYSLKYCTYENVFQILEFGAGEGTIKLSNLLQRFNIPYEYNTFENCMEFVYDIPNVKFHYYPLPSVEWHKLYEWRPFIQNLEMPNLPIADFVIVDGPHGVSRADWYSKFKNFTRIGTVILIDDFHHYKEFGEELDKNFIYETIIEYNHTGSHAIVNDGLEKIDGIVGKCFKIVRVVSVK